MFWRLPRFRLTRAGKFEIDAAPKFCHLAFAELVHSHDPVTFADHLDFPWRNWLACRA